MKKFTVFNGKKTVEIKASIIAEYEEKVGAFTDNTPAYLVSTLGLTEDLPESVLSEEIENAMKEDCNDSAMVRDILSIESTRKELFR